MENTVLQVPIEDIIPNRFQPRLSFDDESLKDLAASIKQHGIIQPLVLRRKNDKYEIIAGERRYKASKLAGLDSVPAIIANMNDNESAEVAIVENVQRKDLTAIEEAKSYQSLLDKGYMTQEELAKKMGLSQSAISNKLRLLTLDESVQDAVMQEKISERHARTLLKLPNHELQKEYLDRVIKERMTVKVLEDEIKKALNETKEVQNVISEPILDKVLPKEESKDMPEKINIPEDIIAFQNPFLPNSVRKNTDAPTEIFSSPENAANKFFNELENTAVNMNVEEIMPDFNTFKVPETEEIEMLDDLGPTTNESINPDTKNDKLEEMINSIKKAAEGDNISIEEIDLGTEYQINIKIKKDL